ncbi:hypothetical protein HNQ85_003559 [Anoxybacillus calidus]|jgi:hypothetical protein|uniref:Uncharacterized protein n=1 Tax=[Anoxybacillus] calidus TaxID=575178 RepID=A0A7V9Z3B3_9BACL|nr:hypothetical protein [Anoxybacillus calidus]MBA2873215.1 hypothetical protein [Anoxybacillus calidus]
MTFPNIPENINPIEDLDKEQVALLLLASIAFEELGLAHIINAEAEKIQFALGTLNNSDSVVKDVVDLLDINRSVERVLRTVIKKEIILQFKLEDVVDFLKND